MKSLPSSLARSSLAIAVAAALAACGGGSGSGNATLGGDGGNSATTPNSGGGGISTAGISGTGISSGPITGFGSIFVNGIRFDIDSAEISVDDASGFESDLRKGMQVVVRGEVSGTEGTAVSVEYDDLLEGPVSGLTADDNGSRTFTVFGVQVIVEREGTVFDDVTYDTLANGNIVEISGLVDASGNIRATYVDKEEDTFTLNSTEVELKGTVSNVTGIGGPGDSFTINGVDIDISLSVDFEDFDGHSSVNNGDYVEVEGIITGVNSIRADEIELEDETPWEDGDDVYLTGIVSGFTDINSNFFVGSQLVDASSADLEPSSLQIRNGLEIEVEGELSGNLLIADEVEAEEGDIQVTATISQINTSSIELSLGAFGSLPTIIINSGTQLEDDTGAVGDLKFSDLNLGDNVSIEAYESGAQLIAAELYRIDPSEAVELVGPVDSVVASSSITVLGVTFSVGPSTEYEDADGSPLTGNAFFASVLAGDIVEIEDEDKLGTASEVAFDD